MSWAPLAGKVRSAVNCTAALSKLAAAGYGVDWDMNLNMKPVAYVLKGARSPPAP